MQKFNIFDHVSHKEYVMTFIVSGVQYDYATKSYHYILKGFNDNVLFLVRDDKLLTLINRNEPKDC